MRDFSIDTLAEQITSPKTKEYFQEIMRSYYSQNYRSAIVLLYSVTIADLVYKLQELKEIYNETSAIDILTEIEQMQRENPKSPDWEGKLVQLIEEKTKLINIPDKVQIDHLKQLRHLCAHPALTQNYELYEPNKETTRAMMCNMLESVLVKPSLLSKKIFSSLLEDISKVRDFMTQYNDIERYVISKYFNNITKTVELDFFRSMWKFVFNIDNNNCNENRDINFKVLKVIVERNYQEVIGLIKKEPKYYNQFLENSIEYIIEIMNTYPKIYTVLDNSGKAFIESIVSKNLNFKVKSLFLSKNLIEHIRGVYEIVTNIRAKDLSYICDIAIEQGYNKEAYDLAIYSFGQSRYYDTADSRFDYLIQPYISDFSEENLHKLIEYSNSNNQIYDRIKAKTTNAIIKEHIDKKIANFDYNPYVNFTKSIK